LLLVHSSFCLVATCWLQVWLTEFARALEQRPTSTCVEQLVAKQQQQLVKACKKAAVDAAQAEAITAATKAVKEAELTNLSARVAELELQAAPAAASAGFTSAVPALHGSVDGTQQPSDSSQTASGELQMPEPDVRKMLR
jgi:hypothetical protein